LAGDAEASMLSAALIELNRNWELTSLVLATGIISGYRYVEHPDDKAATENRLRRNRFSRRAR
jgi:hypothetical protein